MKSDLCLENHKEMKKMKKIWKKKNWEKWKIFFYIETINFKMKENDEYRKNKKQMNIIMMKIPFINVWKYINTQNLLTNKKLKKT